MLISISPKKIFEFLLTAIAVLTVLHIGTRLLIETGMDDNQWFDLFNMDHERTLPTLYSSFTILGAAALLGVTAYLKFNMQQRYGTQWAILSAVFVFLAADEALVLHERLITETISWTVPYTVWVTGLAAYLYRFLSDLPSSTRWQFMLAGTIFVGGAIGMEIPGGYIYHHHKGSILYVLLVTVEEVMEMAGIAFFIYAILIYLTQEFPALQFQVVADRVSNRNIAVAKEPLLVEPLPVQEQIPHPIPRQKT